MVTLTYPAEYPADGRIVMNHWRRMRQWFVRQGNTAGLWFKEFQARGAPHFHVFLPSPVPKETVARAWYDIVGSGDVRHLWAGTRTESLRNPQAAGAYAAKYAAKSLQKEVPDGFSSVGRFWGTWGNPAICRTEVLSGRDAVDVVRTVRRGYQQKRKAWKCRRRFRDNGRSGFTGWESGQIAAQALGHLTARDSALILGSERDKLLTYRAWVGPNSKIEPAERHQAQQERRPTNSSAPEKRNYLDVTQRSLGNLPRSVSLRSG
jgi:hypothetical protein